jgi:hypothetical protein
MSDLSKTMQEAVTFAREQGGSLVRSPGGYWHAPKELQMFGIRSVITFGTSTVAALVSRGVADYTEWKDGRNGRFPVKVTLKATDGIGSSADTPTVEWIHNCKGFDGRLLHVPLGEQCDRCGECAETYPSSSTTQK